LRDHGRAEKNRHVLVGLNSRLGKINDCTLALKLEHLEAWNARRRRIAERYDTALSGQLVSPVAREAGVDSSYHQYVVRTSHRDRLRRHLDRLRIATGIHYPHLIPEQEAFQRLGYSARDFGQARELSRQILSIPCYPELTEAEVDRIIDGISAFDAPA
jgi:dTDP-4-amino-4,6-dideoxygalactose transaminase